MSDHFSGKGFQVSRTRLYLDEPLPPIGNIDWLIIMGGPMGVYDDEEYPWLTAEKHYIGEAIKAGKIVLGICLGAQLIAAAMGARVSRNRHQEIGWFRVNGNEAAGSAPLAGVLPNSVEAFHWHSDTFELPPGAVLLASSEACTHQAFCIGKNVIGFQFHLETTPGSAAALIENCGDALVASRFVQTGAEMTAEPGRFERINHVMAAAIDTIEKANS
jgi:GMP synthase-like glutamine amidotransferase